MALLPAPIEALLAVLGKLPGIGPRSAERIALHIVQSDPGYVQELARAVLNAREQVALCANCGALTERQPCAICSDPKRESGLLCLVERPVDVISLEKSGTFRGRYHVLGGKISPLNGVGPEDLRIPELQSRIGKETVQELIIALPSDVEGDATSYYLAKLLVGHHLKVTRIAQGLPVGSGLEFADELTLSRAMEGRRALEG
jgi:recombination protein RecR